MGFGKPSVVGRFRVLAHERILDRFVAFENLAVNFTSPLMRPKVGPTAGRVSTTPRQSPEDARRLAFAGPYVPTAADPGSLTGGPGRRSPGPSMFPLSFPDRVAGSK
jgi:hypothetical protein